MSFEFDMPPETGHAIPQWLRDHFDVIEVEVRKMGAESVFTQMRTKVQAYFEMLRSTERDMNDELACLRIDAERFQFIAQDAESDLERIYGDDWLAVVDAHIGMANG